MIAKYKAGDKVRINPMATIKDFEKNACTPKFRKRLNEVFTIRTSQKAQGEYVYEIREDDWWLREVCLMPDKEVNEI